MYPKVSQHIDIEINHDHSCRSVVAEVGENEIYINFPMDRTIIGMLSIGTKLDISFIVEGNRYQFVSEIIGRKIDGIPLIKITKPNENSISKIQLREYFRKLFPYLQYFL
jgi:c-di-GMP-binding flagellar brake protein YcgR